MAFLFRGQQIIARTLRSVGRSRSIRLAAAEAGATRSGRRHASAYFPEALKVVATAPNSLLFFSYFSSTVPAEMIKTMSPWRRAIIRTSIGPRSSEFIRRSASSAAPSLSSARCLATTVARSSKRSEEHTSELQSLAYLVCRLLLEKKKKLLLSPHTTRSMHAFSWEILMTAHCITLHRSCHGFFCAHLRCVVVRLY